jgi:hypothetical protein
MKRKSRREFLQDTAVGVAVGHLLESQAARLPSQQKSSFPRSLP